MRRQIPKDYIGQVQNTKLTSSFAAPPPWPTFILSSSPSCPFLSLTPFFSSPSFLVYLCLLNPKWLSFQRFRASGAGCCLGIKHCWCIWRCGMGCSRGLHSSGALCLTLTQCSEGILLLVSISDAQQHDMSHMPAPHDSLLSIPFFKFFLGIDTICFSHTFPSLWASPAHVSLVETHKLISHPSLSLAVFLSFPLIWQLRRATALCWWSFLPQRSLLHIMKRLCSLCNSV